MCGISGYLSIDDERIPLEARKRLGDAIAYRGRDGCGEWADGGSVRLLHSRLSIIDLETGGQPMTDVDDRLVIVFNGEIYNYVELRAKYEAQGAQFRTQSDTEVLLEGYKLRGHAVVHDLIGMFAFAIWDKLNNQLFLARDRLGKKPLYWTRIDGSFFFSSTLDSFSGIPGWTAELSRAALDFYGAVGSFPLGRTAFKQGHSLPPGAFATVRPGQTPKVERYWRLNFAGKTTISTDTALSEYESLLADAIRVRLRADVPVALTFSGGVDSGTLAAIAAQRLGTRLTCFTIDYHTEQDPSEETLIARQVAQHLGLDWHFLHFDYHSELLPALDASLAVVDQPCNHIAISYSQRLYEAIRPHAKVVLSGNGADELFLGYTGNEELALRDKRLAQTQQLWLTRILRRIQGQRSTRPEELADYQCSYIRAHVGTYPDDLSPDELVSTLRADIVGSEVGSHADLYTFMALTYYTCDANFRLPDIAGLRAQVEVRSPFLDHRVVEFAAKLPTSFKIGDPSNVSLNKFLPKEYYRRHVPEAVALAHKKGMGWNLRYDESFAADPRLANAYEEALQMIDKAGLNSRRYRKAWDEFRQSKAVGEKYPPAAGTMIAGFMLGRWLRSRNRTDMASAPRSYSAPAGKKH
jgi:asparagine synthase (glutamine-hydrolysing)